MLAPYDKEALRAQFRSAEPFPFVAIDDFLEPAFAKEVAASYPTFEVARGHGHEFRAVNEAFKVQVTDEKRFPEPVRRLSNLLSSDAFLSDLAYITGIPNLLWDRELVGGGMHLTGPRGRLDVHVDFNYVPERQLHRRLNILIYLNPRWEEAWGGAVELWNRDVTERVRAFKPQLNRCVIFETSEISFHGVEPVRCPPDVARMSFAAYYYTREAPAGWDGTQHTTIFRARPHEKVRRYVLMPLEQLQRSAVPQAKRVVKKLLGRK
ncbi:MAG: 2OG-Fe(II) oxygenase [Myxococcales bacterium]|nr:2OG-Fe(II) oxygenase [Myxococcales bacterium]